MIRSLLLAALVSLTATFSTTAQDTKKTAPKQPAKKDNVLAPVKDVPGLPRVLLIGDSISMGYTIPTREALKGVANVHRPPVNCGPTTRGAAEIDKWLGDGKWDVIHFNFGLHDLKYVDDKGAAVSPSTGKVQVTIEDYKKNLDAMIGKMKKTGAKLIFATTTPVPAGEKIRKENSDREYNAAALEVMKSHGVAIDDLNAFVRSRKSEGQLPSNVHFTPDGSKALADQVASEVKKSLGK